MIINLNIDIQASPQTVFDVVTHVRSWPDNISAIEAVEVVSEGPVRVGTVFRETRTLHGRTTTEEMSVTELEPSRLFTVTAENHGTRYRAEQRLVPTGSGCRLEISFEGRAATLMAILMMPMGLLFRGTVRRMLEDDLKEIKAVSEKKA